MLLERLAPVTLGLGRLAGDAIPVTNPNTPSPDLQPHPECAGLYVNMITMENRLAQLEGLNAELDVKVDEFQVGTLQGGIDGLPAIGLFGTDYDPPGPCPSFICR